MQDMLRSWSEPFREAHGHRSDVKWYELSLVESMVGLLYDSPLWMYHHHLHGPRLAPFYHCKTRLCLNHSVSFILGKPVVCCQGIL